MCVCVREVWSRSVRSEMIFYRKTDTGTKNLKIGLNSILNI